MRTTKAQLLAGREPEPFAVPALGGDEVLIRPLSAAEAEDVQAAEVAGIKISGDAATVAQSGAKVIGQAAPRGARATASQQKVEVDVASTIRGAAESLILAAAYGLVEPQLTVDEVRQIRPALAVEQIGEEVKARSGLGDDTQRVLERFRPVGGGPGDAPAPPDGDAAGQDAG